MEGSELSSTTHGHRLTSDAKRDGQDFDPREVIAIGSDRGEFAADQEFFVRHPLANPFVFVWVHCHLAERYGRFAPTSQPDSILPHAAAATWERVVASGPSLSGVTPSLFFLRFRLILPPHLWPDSIATSVEDFEIRPDGGVRVKLVSKLAARRPIFEATGKLKDSTRDGVRALARAIRGDLELPEPGNDGAAS